MTTDAMRVPEHLGPEFGDQATAALMSRARPIDAGVVAGDARRCSELAYRSVAGRHH